MRHLILVAIMLILWPGFTVSAQSDGAGRDAPFGMPSLDQFERERKGGAPERSAPSGEKQAGGPKLEKAGLEEAAPVAVKIDPNDPEIKQLAMKFLVKQRVVQERMATLRSREQDAFAIKLKIDESLNAATVRPLVEEMNEYLASVKLIRDDIKKKTKEAEELTQQIIAIREQADAEEEAKRLAEEQRKREEEHKALVEAEIAQIEAAKGESAEQVKTFGFQEALDSASGLAAQLQTDEGKLAVEVLVSRYTYLADFKAFLVEQISSDPMRWGWARKDGSRDHLAGATEKGVKVGNRIVPWTEIPVGQFRRILDNYLSKTRVPIAVRSKMHLAAAIFFHDVGQVSASDKHANKAVEMSPYLQEDVDRFLTD